MSVFFAQHQLHPFQFRLGSHQVQQVAERQHGIGAWRHQLLAPLEPRGHHALIHQSGHVPHRHALEIGVADGHVQRFDLGRLQAAHGLEAVGLGHDVDPEHGADQHHGQQDADDAERIGDGVAQPGQADIAVSLQGLLGDGERRSIGHRTGHQPEHRRQGDAAQPMNSRGDQHPERHDRGRQCVERQARPFQGGEEARPYLHADGVDEQDQAKFLQKSQGCEIDVDAHLMDEMPDGNAAEHHAPHPEADPLDLEAAQPEAERGDRAKQKDAESDVTHTDIEPWFG